MKLSGISFDCPPECLFLGDERIPAMVQNRSKSWKKQPDCPEIILPSGANTPPTAVGWPVLSQTGIATGIPFKMICGVFSGRLFWNWQETVHA